MDILDKFPDKIMPVPFSGCWLWLGASHGGDDYGTVGHAKSAHRLSYLLSFGSISEKAHVLHTCDTPLCVNPAHLFLGTAKDNAQDRERKGRRRKLLGEEHGMAWLTEEQVLKIRSAYAQGGRSQRSLANEYNVSQANIFYVLRKVTWSHL